MLILPNADGLGVDFDELRQRVLQPARDGYRRAQVYVVLRKLFRRQLRRRVDGRARLAHDHVGHPAAERADKLHRHGLRLTRGGAVADGDVLHTVFARQCGKRVDGLLLFLRAERRVDDGGIEHLSRRVHDGDLASVRVAGVKSHRNEALDRRLHEKRPEVEGKIVDGRRVCTLGECVSELALEAWRDEACEAVFAHRREKRHCARTRLHHGPAHDGQARGLVQIDGHLELAFAFAAVEGQNLVVLQLSDWLGEIKVQPVDGVFVLRCGFAR